MPPPSNGNHKESNLLGTFGGVFTPSILTILGVIMFMRAGFVVGQAGILQALLILLLAKSITTLTSLSIAAVSTNTPVAGGGAYFLISRALGPEFGGAIGLALFLAQAVSVPFYIIGFTEALVRSFPLAAPHFRTIAIATTAVLFALAFVGARWAIKTQYLIMAVLALAIIAFLGGALANFQAATFRANWLGLPSGKGIAFWALFAIYFPAVTGIMSGVNMSGDLKDPARSIPLGTLAAVATGLVVYLIQILLCGGAQSRTQLVDASFETLASQALFGAGYLVVAGVFAATLSSALGSFLGAPRVLQAVAKDGIIRILHPFAKGTAGSDEPRRALLLTLVITVGVILWASAAPGGGAFNAIAAVVTMFFLYTYGMINLAAFVESFAGNPSFRPRFRYYHWLPAVLGAVACAGVAFLIDPLAAAVAALILLTLYFVLHRYVMKVRYGDARWGFVYSRVRRNLLKLSAMSAHPKNWRPIVLVLTGDPQKRFTMAMFALWIGAERGLVTLARVLEGDIKELSGRRETAVGQLRKFLKENEYEALSTVVVSKSLDAGLSALIQGHPVGPLRPNLVMMGWPASPERGRSVVEHIAAVRLLGMSTILVKEDGLPRPYGRRRIDIWWGGQANGSLMVLLAHLLKLNWEWSTATIRLLRLLDDEAGRDPATEATKRLLEKARVIGEVSVLISDSSLSEVIQRHSKDASVVLLGFSVPEVETAGEFQERFEEMLVDLPTTLLVCSSGDADVLA